jgi:hypothetical protein
MLESANLMRKLHVEIDALWRRADRDSWCELDARLHEGICELAQRAVEVFVRANGRRAV